MGFFAIGNGDNEGKAILDRKKNIFWNLRDTNGSQVMKFEPFIHLLCMNYPVRRTDIPPSTYQEGLEMGRKKTESDLKIL